MKSRTHLTDNAAWSGAAPKLSVLIPCFRDDPTRLLAALDRVSSDVEVVVLDDGSGDAALAERIASAVRQLALPARFVRLEANEGRSRGRNRLANAARAPFFLFLDADMLPDRADFLDRWLALATDAAPAAAFGGFSLDQAPKTAAHAVHRAMALRSDCLTAEARRAAPEKHVFTSNLLIRRDVFEQSAANFARVAAAHPQIVRTYPSYRAARMLKRAPLRDVWRPWLKAAALTTLAPVAARAFALRLYRAALYAEAV